MVFMFPKLLFPIFTFLSEIIKLANILLKFVLSYPSKAFLNSSARSAASRVPGDAKINSHGAQ